MGVHPQPRITGAIIDAIQGVNPNTGGTTVVKEVNVQPNQPNQRLTKIRYYPVYVPYPYPDHGNKNNYHNSGHHNNYPQNCDYHGCQGQHGNPHGQDYHNAGHYRGGPKIDIGYEYVEDVDDDDDDDNYQYVHVNNHGPYGHNNHYHNPHGAYRSFEGNPGNPLFRSLLRMPIRPSYVKPPPYKLQRYNYYKR